MGVKMANASQYALDTTVLRATGVIALVAIGAMHFLQIAVTFQGTPLLGVAYVGLISASVAFAAWLAAANDLRAWTGAGLLCVAIIVGYSFTRLVSTPFDNQDVGNWSCMLGLATLFVEAALLAVSGYALALAHAENKAAPSAWKTAIPNGTVRRFEVRDDVRAHCVRHEAPGATPEETQREPRH
jgi:hypothetical protein